jgi:lipoprotein-anchoring transpeptidase ErfK/SrfK
MHSFVLRFFIAVSCLVGLTACVPDPAMIEAGIAKAPEPKIVEGVYAASTDAGFAVVEVPVDKVPSEFQRQIVYYPSDLPKDTIVINPAEKHLYLVTGKNQAMRYGIAVGRAGFQWSGEALITNRNPWPTWTPPPEMIERKPELIKWEKGQPGGPENPLGARALYLTTNGVDYGYRIHGTPEWFSIGKNASSGCIRMINQDVIDLYERVPDGSKVIVLNADGSMPKGLTLPPPQPKKPKPAVDPSVTPVVMQAIPSFAQPSAVPGTALGVAPAAVPAILPVVTPKVPSVLPQPKTAPLITAPLITAPANTAVTSKVIPTVAMVPQMPCSVALVNGVCPILVPKAP